MYLKPFHYFRDDSFNSIFKWIPVYIDSDREMFKMLKFQVLTICTSYDVRI